MKFITTAILSLSIFANSYAAIIYVSPSGISTNGGTSWADSYLTLTNAIANSIPGDDIWVMQGTYTPGMFQNTTFQIPSGVALYGGFSPTATNMLTRDWTTFPTILSGDLNGDDSISNFTDNAFSVVTPGGNSRINGFVISGGHNTSTGLLGGAGMLITSGSVARVENCVFVGNEAYFGGALFIDNNNSEIINCTFTDNKAQGQPSSMGGAIASLNSSYIASNCVFTGNQATFNGGAISISGGTPRIINSILSGNVTLTGNGAATYIDKSAASINNCTIVNNKANTGMGGGIFSSTNSNWSISNSIVYFNTHAGGIPDQIMNGGNFPFSLGYNCIEDSTNGISGLIGSAVGMISSGPAFSPSQQGLWSLDATFDPTKYQSTISASPGGWANGELIGKFVRPDTNSPIIYMIVSNNFMDITVWGNLTGTPLSAMSYEIFDYHLESPAGRWEPGFKTWSTNDISYSPCIDMGDPSGPFLREISPNGNRLNIGAYGNTPEASKSSTIQPATWFKISGISSPLFAGQYTSVTVSAWNGTNIWNSYTGTVAFSASASGIMPSDYTFTISDAGTHVFTNQLQISDFGDHINFDVYDISDSTMNGHSEFPVFSGTTSSLDRFIVWNILDPIETGKWTEVSIAAVDPNMALNTNYTGQVNFSSSDPTANLPNAGSYTYTGFDNGVKTFPSGILFHTIGEHWFKAVDNTDSNIASTIWNITAEGSGLDTNIDHFAIEINHITTTNRTESLAIEARNSLEQPLNTFTGTVNISSTDPSALFTPSATFNIGDNGRIFMPSSVQFQTLGMQSMSVNLLSNTNITGTASNIYVETEMGMKPPFSAEFNHLALVGEPFSFTVKALNNSEQTDTNYLGTINFASSDIGATLPPPYTFQPSDKGVKTFTNIVFSIPDETILTIEDQATPGMINDYDVMVLLGGATNTTSFMLDIYPRPALTNQWLDVMLVAIGDEGLVNTNYSNPVDFTGSGTPIFSTTPFNTFNKGIAIISNQVMYTSSGDYQVFAEESGNTNVFGITDISVYGGSSAFYVNEHTGSDTFSGNTPAAAFASITKAASVMTPGDVAIIASGYYPESINISSSGSALSYITFYGDTEGRYFPSTGPVSIQPGSAPAFLINSFLFISLANLDIQGTSSSTGIVGISANNIRIENCEFKDHFDAINLNSSTNVGIKGNFIEHNTGNGITAGSLCDGLKIEDNEIRSNAYGIHVTGANNTIISYNKISSNSMDAILISSNNNAGITYNIIDANSANGISIADGAANAKVSHNLITGNSGDGIALVNAGVGNMIINNSMANNGNGLILTTSDGQIINNNILAFSASNGFNMDTSSTNTTTWGYNCVFGNGIDWANSASPGDSSISNDPAYASSGAGSEDLHLQSTTGRRTSSGYTVDLTHSPCIDAGNPADPYDNEPLPNGGRRNMGAFGDTKEASLSSTIMNYIDIDTPFTGTEQPTIGTNYFPQGTNLTLSITNLIPGATGIQYTCTGWTGGSGSVPTSGTNTSVNITLTNDSSLTWTWTTNYNLNISSNINGSVNVANGWYPNGTNLSITATPSNTYSFTGWTGDIITNSNPLNLNMTQAFNLTPVFTLNTHTITALTDVNGSITPTGTTVVAEGTNITFNLTPNVNYHVTNCVVDLTPIGATNSYTFTNVVTNHTIEAQFGIDMYDLIVSTPTGTASPAAGTNQFPWNTPITSQIINSPVNFGATQRLVCTSWVGTGSAPPSGVGTNTGAFNITTNSSVTWNWATEYYFTSAAGPNGIVDIPSAWYSSGSNVVITATPMGGYSFVGWSGNIPAINTNNNPLTVTMDQARSVTANFSISVGSVRINISPVQANSAGAMWRLTTGPDTTWQNNGTVVPNIPLTGNPYTVTFQTIAGWTAPMNFTNVVVTNTSVTLKSGTYYRGSMALIPGNTFAMGLISGAGGHPVTLDPFFMDRKEVTVGEFQTYITAISGTMPTPPTWGWSNTNLPMVNVTWAQAAAYASWIGKRLPTEAEYEYAMRSGAANNLYPWGNSITPANANFNNNIGMPTIAGTYPANTYGLYDISGNVWEWCSDWYASTLHGPILNPVGPSGGTLKTIRGGSWISFASRLQCGPRFSMSPLSRHNDLGFRCVGTADTGGNTQVAGDINNNNIPDWWEILYFGSTTGFNAAADTDGDTQSNYKEYLAGTDPLDPTSVLLLYISYVSSPTPGYKLEWTSQVGKQYEIWKSTNLIQGFSLLTSGILSSPPMNTYIDASPAAPVQYYRVKTQ